MLRLAAQRTLYRRAEIWRVCQFILMVAVPLIGTMVTAQWVELQPMLAAYGLVITFIDTVVIEDWIKAQKLLAARIQEIFDCEVLQLVETSCLMDPRPDTESINHYGRALLAKPKEKQSLVDWYPVSVANLPLPKARLICQRMNAWWTAKLRVAIAWGSGIALVAILVVGLWWGITSGVSISDFLMAATPFLPVLIWLVRELRHNIEAANGIRRLQTRLVNTWEAAVKGDIGDDQLLVESRAIQDKLFERRKTDPTIPPLLYNSTRRWFEENMVVSAEQLVQEMSGDTQADAD